MKPRNRSGVTLLLVPLLFACGRNERTLDIRGEFVVERTVGLSGTVEMQGRLHEAEIPSGEFNIVWNAITRGVQNADAIAVTLAGGTQPDPSFVSLQAGMVLFLPAPLAAGAVYPVDQALTVPEAALPVFWAYWGERRITNLGHAEMALRVFDNYAIGGGIQNVFNATAVNGTVEVLRRRGEQVELHLDVTATDDLGREVVVRGDFVMTPESYTPPIT